MIDLIDRLEGAVRSEDWPEIAEIRHAIEGTARGSGAAAIVTLIGDMKTLAAAKPVERYARIVELRDCFAATRESMREFLSRQGEMPPHVESRAEQVTPAS